MELAGEKRLRVRIADRLSHLYAGRQRVTNAAPNRSHHSSPSRQAASDGECLPTYSALGTAIPPFVRPSAHQPCLRGTP